MLQDKKLWHMSAEIYRSADGKPARVVWQVKESKIRYLVLCYGMPLRIEKDPDLKELAAESMRVEFRRDEAAVDSELACLPAVNQKNPLSGPLVNPMHAATNALAINPTNGVLMVARLDGPTPAIARGLVDKAIEAETTGLWGRAYFDLRGITNAEYKPGDDALRKGAEICRHLGFETVIDNVEPLFPAEFPMSQIGIYCGWYSENIGERWRVRVWSSCPARLRTICFRSARPRCEARIVSG